MPIRPVKDPILTQTPTPVQVGEPLSVDGAYIEEALDSDHGNFIALDRKDVAKRYIVRVPLITDKPVRFLRAAFPVGSLYPGREEDYAGLVVWGYDEGERINESDTAWHAAVIYSTLDRLATLNWITEGEFSEEQEHIEYDESDTPRLIGSAVYEPAGTGVATHTAPTADGDIVQLRQSAAKRVTGLDRPRGIFRFTMSRVLFTMTWTQIRLVGSRLSNVNSDVFLTYEPGELMLQNFGLREVYGMFPATQSASNKNVEVRLQFAANYKRWSPVYIPDEYQDDKGYRSVVSPTVLREYFPHRSTSFYGLFSALNVSSPVVV